MIIEPQFPPQEAHDRLEALIARALEARLAQLRRIRQRAQTDGHFAITLAGGPQPITDQSETGGR